MNKEDRNFNDINKHYLHNIYSIAVLVSLTLTYEILLKERQQKLMVGLQNLLYGKWELYTHSWFLEATPSIRISDP